MRRDYSAGLDHYTVVQKETGMTDYYLARTFLGSYKDSVVAQRCIESRQLKKLDDDTRVSCRLLDERIQDTNVQHHVETVEQIADAHGPNPDDPMLIIDAWEELRLLLEENQLGEDAELQLVMYGLFQASIGTRHSVAHFTIEAVRQSVLQAWQDYLRPGTTAYLHLVRPQQISVSPEIQLIVEFTNRFFDRPVEDIPVARKVSWEGVWSEAEPVAAYHTQGISTFQLLIQCRLMEWCGPDLRTTWRGVS